MSEPFGEIVASNLTQWTVQSWDLNQFPPFGALVVCSYNQYKAFGVIAGIQTGPQDTSRTPHAFGKSLEELAQQQPHIFQFLVTTLITVPVGYEKDAQQIYALPPQPASIHSFVAVAHAATYKTFFASSNWMVLFFNLFSQNPLFDELLVAILQQAAEHAALTQDRVTQVITLFSLLMGDDYRKLKLFLQRIEKLS
jgi:hypothetical protein